MDCANDTKILLYEMRRLLNNKPEKKITIEGIVFGEDGDEMIDGQGFEAPVGGNGFDGDGYGDMEQGRMNMGVGGMEKDIESRESNPLDGDPEISKLITKIRVMTLQGLTKLAETPDTSQYELLKKIFLLVDKAVEDKVDPEKQ